MSKLYYQKDMRLIKNSSIIDDYPLLIEAFEKYPELEDYQLGILSYEMHTFLENIYPKVKLQAINEWKVDTSRGIEILDYDKKIQCQLCNHYIKNVCYIKNELNNNILKVGTECVKHFEFNGNLELEKLFKKRKEIKRIERLNYQLPDIEKVVSQWNLIINQQPIFIKESIKGNYLRIGNEIENLYYEYINKKSLTVYRETEIINEIKKLLELSEKQKDIISEYVRENEYNKLIPTKDIMIYLKNSNDFQGLKWIEEDGKIKNRTLFRIKNENFAKKLIPEFNNTLRKHGIEIKNVKKNNDKLGYSIILNKNPNIELFCDYGEFTMTFGGIITNEEIFSDIKQLEILKMGMLKDIDSIEYALGIIENSLQKYWIKYDELYYDFNEMLWVKEKSGKEQYYILTKLNDLYELLKEIAYKVRKYSSRDLYDIIMKNSETLGNSDAKEFKKNRNRMMA